MSEILVTGGSGQVATALERAALARAAHVRVVGRPEFDFDQPESLAALFTPRAPALLVNAAAWTAVDRAEAEAEAAERANHLGPARLAALCARHGTRLIHISTDYVFDGCKGAPYVESDPPCPTGVYGRTKLAGEGAVLAACPGALVLRTSWVYAATGRNFIRTMLAAARQRRALRVVADQIGCPTAAEDLAAAILALPREAPGGVFHLAGAGWTSWHGLAEAAFDAAAHHGLARPEVTAITTAQWPTPAARPADSRLDCSAMARACGIALPPWQDSLRRVVGEIMRA